MRITLLLIAISLAVFGLQFVPGVTETFSLTPSDALAGSWWQFFTYMFLHGDAMHILLNMFALGIFGPLVEEHIGRQKFSLLYLLSGLGSAALYLGLSAAFADMAAFSLPLLGASGAVFGIMTAYGFYFPRNWIMIYFVPLPAVAAVILITAFELFAGIFNLFPGIASFGHVGGIITSLCILLFWRFLGRHVPPEDRQPRSYEFVWE